MGGLINDVVNVATFGLVDDITGADAAQEASTNAANVAANSQNEALNYLKEREALPQELREGALTKLSGFYGLGEGAAGFDSILQDPFVQSQIASRQGQSEEAILRNAGATGMLRSGNAMDALAKNAPNVQQQVINEYLQGLGGFAQLPSNANTIANQQSQIGMTHAQGILGGAQAQQDVTGMLIGGGLQGLGAFAGAGGFSDRELKDDVQHVGIRNGFNWYRWTWNEKAETLGMSGEGEGVIADEVAHIPGAVTTNAGYQKVNYAALGV